MCRLKWGGDAKLRPSNACARTRGPLGQGPPIPLTQKIPPECLLWPWTWQDIGHLDAGWAQVWISGSLQSDAKTHL